MQRGLLIRRGPIHFGGCASNRFAPAASNVFFNQACFYATEAGSSMKQDPLTQTIGKQSAQYGSASGSSSGTSSTSSIGWNDSPQGRRGKMRDAQRMEERMVAKDDNKEQEKRSTKREDEESDDEGDNDRERRGHWYNKQEQRYSDMKSGTRESSSQYDASNKKAAKDTYNVDNLADLKKEGTEATLKQGQGERSGAQDFENQEMAGGRVGSNMDSNASMGRSSFEQRSSGKSGKQSGFNSNINYNEMDKKKSGSSRSSSNSNNDMDNNNSFTGSAMKGYDSNFSTSEFQSKNSANYGYGATDSTREPGMEKLDRQMNKAERQRDAGGGSMSGDLPNEGEKAQFGDDDDIIDYKTDMSTFNKKNAGAADTIDIQQEQQDIKHRKEADSTRAPRSKTTKDGKNARPTERAPGFLDAQS